MGNEVLFSENIKISLTQDHILLPVQLEATPKGIQRYEVKLSALEGEFTLKNNSADVFIDVLDGRQKVLLLANSPHPDVKALRETIESSDNYEAEVFLANEFKLTELKKYNLVVLHQVPSLQNPSLNLLKAITLEKIPVLFILGSETDWNGFNTLQAGMTVSGGRGKTTECQPVFDKNFSLFTLSDESKNYFRNFPPLQVPLASFKLTPSANVLFFQKIGMVETSNPLVFFNSLTEKKSGVICGVGLWRWKLNDFAQHGNHAFFNEVFLKTVQYLALRENKNKFRISGRNNFLENEPVVFDAELYNESFELINEPEVNFEIVNEEEKKFPFVFSKTGRGYHLDAGIFPVGNYRYEAKTKVGETILNSKGEFSISPVRMESVNTVADHQLLFNLSKKHNGEMIFPAQINDLPGMLKERKDISSISFSHKKLIDIINLKWIFFLLFSLLSLEWFLRKRNGSY